MFDLDTFQHAYQNASSESQAVVDSEAIGSCCRSVVENEQLDASHYRSLVFIQALITLGVLDRGKAILEIRSLGVPRAELVYAALQTCVANHANRPSTEELTQGIKEMEAVLSEISHKSDNTNTNKDGVYSSSQSDILRSNKTDNRPPKWNGA
jgi:hypothetical protein